MTATVATKNKTKTASEIAEKLLADESFTNKLDKERRQLFQYDCYIRFIRHWYIGSFSNLFRKWI